MSVAPTVTAVIVNYATPEVTANCVRHLRGQNDASLDIIVVDNPSTAEQLERLKSLLPGERIVSAPENHGYAGGLNVGVQAAWPDAPEYFWMVTPDALPDPDCLKELLAAMNANRRVGVVGPAIDAAGEWVIGCRLLESLGFMVRMVVTSADEIPRLSPLLRTDFVEGCSMLIRAAAVQQAGPLRTEFFMYYEECEYCLRLADLGWAAAVVPRARVHTRARGLERNSRSYYMIRNGILLARLRRRGVAVAAVRGLVESCVRAVRSPRFLAVGLQAVRDGWSMPLRSLPSWTGD